MERTKYQTYNQNISQMDLVNAESMMSGEELQEMRRRINEIVSCMAGFGTQESRALAEKMFRLGYLSAHVLRGTE